MKALELLNSFTTDNLPNLDKVVLWALELFIQNPPKKLDIAEFKKPLIAGSGNAITTARNIFSNTNALFCDETKIDDYLQKDIDWLIICSASWEKHAFIFAKKAKEKWIKTKLLTCNKNSSTELLIWSENTVITTKNREPYTYNTSTYMWWMFAITWENPKNIHNFIKEEINPILKNIDFSKYEAYLVVTPDKFALINKMFEIKFVELFWRFIARDVFSFEQINHAVTIHPNKDELAISFWEWDFYYIWDKINFPLPENTNLATMMAIWYYVIWKIQEAKPAYFQKNIGRYIEGMNELEFGKGLEVIVE